MWWLPNIVGTKGYENVPILACYYFSGADFVTALPAGKTPIYIGLARYQGDFQRGLTTKKSLSRKLDHERFPGFGEHKKI